MKRVAIVVFLLVSIGELIAILFQIHFLHHLCKPLILLSLLAYYLLSVTRENRSMIVVMGILFSFFGDTFLLYEKEYSMFFIFGLLSFLVAHIFYIVAYRQHRFEDTGDKLHGIQKIRFAFPIILAGTGLVVILYPVLGDLQIPVVIYALVLTIMVVQALFRLHRTSDASFWMVFMGAVLFMLSDSILAINKFLGAISFASFWIMSSYILAQFLIVQGLLKHIEASKN
jgi:uncharacterized membrane protein YhhN